MKKKAIPAVVAAAVLMVLALRCSSYGHARYQSYGPEIVAVKAAPQQVAGAVQTTCNALIHEIDLGDGRKARPSFRQSGQTWDAGTGGQREVFRGVAEFDASDGAHHTIQTVHLPGDPALILPTPNPPEARLTLHNELMNALRKSGIHPR